MTLLFATIPAVQAAGWRIAGEDWARPRGGEEILQMPALRSALAALDSAPAAELAIRYPGGETGGLWAHELRGWLIALGLPGQRIRLLPGGVDGAELRLELLHGRAP
ncbi:hypothetical protein [Thiohalobacter sp.]|uniref:hypothetical protein n=1 Tax=Thiohalobacter sp. TaxID=2025948 RepID=UPI002622B0C4|nr:hypothetical protein [Thiohalobacter sp.]